MSLLANLFFVDEFHNENSVCEYYVTLHTPIFKLASHIQYKILWHAKNLYTPIQKFDLSEKRNPGFHRFATSGLGEVRRIHE